MNETVICPRCQGWGHIAPFNATEDEEPCPLCEGAGEITEEAARKAQAEARAIVRELED